jgi:exopolyphosphatase/pppGpp-phosphohydrolase
MRIWVFYFTLIFALFYLSCLASEPDQNKRDTGLICAVDMGSNTFKFVVAELKNGKYIQHTDVRKTAGVGDDLRASEQKLKRKIISDAKIQQIQSILTEFQNDCENRTGSRRFRAIATAAFREAENIEFISRKLEEQGVRIQVLTPEEESIFAYEAATLGETGLAVVDVGSRTTEFVHKSPDGYKWVLLNTGYQNAWKDF